MRRVVPAAIVAALGITSAPAPATAIDTGPRAIYSASTSDPGVQVSGTFTPVVGNFAGGAGDDIFWYAPGPAPDHLWTSTGRGTFTKAARSVNGTYRPVVGDFTGDDYDDIIWYAPGTAPDVLWTSVPGPAVFTSSPLQIDGDYQPVVLDGSIDLAVAITHASAPLPNDTIIWYRPGPASDVAWGWGTDGTHSSYAVAIDGSPQLVPFNANADTLEDLLAYTPGPGPDAVYTYDTGALIKTPKTVNGSYRPTVIGGGYRDRVLWHGPEAAPDAYWTNFSWSGLTSSTTQAIGGTSVWPASDGGQAYVYRANGPDRGFVDGYDLVSTDGDIGPGARPFVGDFDADLGPDTYFYRPGGGTDTLRFGQTPVII
jgi:hypothetical protein